MTEQELRVLVREAIARHTVAPFGAAVHSLSAGVVRMHPSHGMFPVPAGGDAEGPCLIEPAVTCNRCGYCKSYGH